MKFVSFSEKMERLKLNVALSILPLLIRMVIGSRSLLLILLGLFLLKVENLNSLPLSGMSALMVLCKISWFDVMEEQEFRKEFDSLLSSLGKLSVAISGDLSLSSVLSISEFFLLENLLKEYSYYLS